MTEGRVIPDLLAEPTGVPLGEGPVDAVVIGASLGGPPALQRVLREFPADMSAPVAICQHIEANMVELFAEQLDRACRLPVAVAEHREPLEPGRVYVAPVGRHLRLMKERGISYVRLDEDFSDALHVPSVDVMFSSAAMSFGSCTLAVLLTGMGADGALGMHAVRRAGGYTLCESAETATSYSMPRAAIELGAAAAELPIDGIAGAIVERVERGANWGGRP